MTNSAKETLKNTSIVGISRVVTILITIVKTKFIAILIGPTGIGLMGLFRSSIALIQSTFGLGLGFSAVRDISENIATDLTKVSRTIVSLKRWTLFASSIGVVLTLLFSKYISLWTFKSEEYQLEICLLSITILITNISLNYTAIIQGARRMADFAKAGIYGALISTIFTIPIFFYYKEQGIVPALIITSIVSLVVNIVFTRRIKLKEVYVNWKDSYTDGFAMVELGLFTVFTGFITQGTLYYVQVSIGENLGIDSIGYYTAATTLAVKYMSIIFQAMGADYFPKLSAINRDDSALNSAVILQTKIVLLLGVPLILGMYTFSEYLILIVYSSEFYSALPILMWLLLSVFLRLIGFPIGYVFLAKGKSKIFVFTQSFWNLIFLVFVFVVWKMEGGLEGIGIAFALAYLFGVILNIVIIKKLTKFRYDAETKIMILYMSAITFLFFLSSQYFDGGLVLVLKASVLLAFTVWCVKRIEKIADLNLISAFVNKFRKNE